MDKDYRGHVRFKDLCRFIKNHKRGKAYEKVDIKDSSLSSSEEYDTTIRLEWEGTTGLDPERNGRVSIYKVAEWIEPRFGIPKKNCIEIIAPELH